LILGQQLHKAGSSLDLFLGGSIDAGLSATGVQATRHGKSSTIAARFIHHPH
jgi:hypothetical protein